MTNKRGGSRQNSGRKTEDNASAVKRRQVTLDQSTIDTLTALGRGNLSLGIREAARRAGRQTTDQGDNPWQQKTASSES